MSAGVRRRGPASHRALASRLDQSWSRPLKPGGGPAGAWAGASPPRAGPGGGTPVAAGPPGGAWHVPPAEVAAVETRI
eukprot:1993034-Lingulodinium_polyedra.AAC.1